MTTPFHQNPVGLFYLNPYPTPSWGRNFRGALTFAILRFRSFSERFCLPLQFSKRESFFSRKIGYFLKHKSFSPS